MTREELVKKAKELAEREDLKSVIFEARKLRKQWRNAKEDEESFYDRELTDQFFSYLDAISIKEGESYANVEDRKRNIISRAKEILNEKNFKKANNKMNDLLEEWKEAGRSKKELDDSLWDEFRTIRNAFYDNRRSFIEQQKENFEKTKLAKEEIIEKAKEANKLDNFKEIGKIMDDLMEEWKKLGSAGRKDNDALWEAFSAERKAFYKNRTAYYDSLKEVFKERANTKKEIIEKAQKNLAISSFNDEEYAQMKEFRSSWKDIGFAGKNKDDELWEEFNKIMNTYFENAKYYREK